MPQRYLVHRPKGHDTCRESHPVREVTFIKAPQSAGLRSAKVGTLRRLVPVPRFSHWSTPAGKPPTDHIEPQHGVSATRRAARTWSKPQLRRSLGSPAFPDEDPPYDEPANRSIGNRHVGDLRHIAGRSAQAPRPPHTWCPGDNVAQPWYDTSSRPSVAYDRDMTVCHTLHCIKSDVGDVPYRAA